MNIIDWIKFIMEKYKMNTAITILLIIGLNYAFYKWHDIIQVNEIVSRLLIHLMSTMIIIMVELLRRWFNSKPLMVPLFGAWWNRYGINNLEPFCAGCKELLVPTVTGGSNVFTCSNGHEICFRDYNGNPIDIGTLRTLVKNRLQKGVKTGKVQ